MPKSRIIVPEEKWADDVFVHSDDPEDLKRVEAILADGIPDFHGIHDVDQPKTDAETAAVQEVTAAMNVFRAQLGLDMIGFNPDRCHLLTAEDFGQHVSHALPGSTAMAMYGHCYLTRPADTKELVIDLTHEMAHATGYLAIDVVPLREGKPVLRLFRTGYLQVRRHSDEQVMIGLNEAATEIVAMRLRHIIARGSRLLSQADAERLTRDTVLYYPQVQLLVALVNDLMDRHPVSQTPLNEFFLGYLTGERRFLRRLGRRYPGILRAVCRMGVRPESAIAVAERFGLTETAEEIRQVLAKRRTGDRS